MDKIQVASPQIGEEEIEAVVRVLHSGNYVSGQEVAAFEREFAAHCGVQEAVAVSTGTAAIQASLDAAGVGPGDEVIVPALTFFSTATAVIHQAGIPVFADLSADNFSLCPDSFAAQITPRTKAVIPVHYLGHVAEMDAIKAIAQKHGIIVIEDCAQAHGSLYRGNPVGSLGDFGAFSFYATKNLTTGEGGMITTNDPAAALRMRRFRSHGLVNRDDHELLGYNYRMTEMAAAIGRVQLRRLASMNASRTAVSERILSAISDIPWLSVPKIPDHVVHSYFWCPILIDEVKLGMTTRDLIAHLDRNGIETRNRYIEPLYRQPLLTRNIPRILKLSAGQHLPDYARLRLPVVERVAGRLVGLPNRPNLTEAEINRIVAVLKSM